MRTTEELYEEAEKHEAFRDHLSTVDDRGKRVWLYPKKPTGAFHRLRIWVSVVLLGLLFGGPFIKIEGNPILLFNVFERKFVLLGQIFWPQDFHLFAIALITLVVFVILFTVVYGRIFCGWFCPQTIFMEMAFRKIEYWIEGDYMAQRKLDKQPWNAEKISKKSLKQLLFVFISSLIMHTFMAYLIGVEQVWEIITEPPSEHLAGFMAMIILTGLFYGVFARFREQVCTTVCPYGRLQGVLLDKNSVVVAYDYARGEKREKFRKGENREEKVLGDCIDCKQCVLVCPTGIDIRNGTQLECVNCTACIDACDSIMDHIGKPRGLVRFASEETIANGTPFRFTRRMLAYSAVLTILVTVFCSMLLLRSEVEMTLMRTPGVLYQEREDGRVSNLYNVKVINKTSNDITFDLKVLNQPNVQVEWIGGTPTAKAQSAFSGSLFILMPKEDILSISTKLKLGVYEGEKEIETVKTTFLGPN